MVPPDHAPTAADPTSPNADLVVSAARALAASSSLESLSRPFLDMLHTLTGMESTYLTEVRPEHGDQVIRFADNRGGLDIGEGVSVNWEQSLCRRALETKTYLTDDAAATFPDSPIPQTMGITSYVSVPVLSSDDVVMGTLCGASSTSMPVAVSVVDVMSMLARLIADQWERDRRHEAALERAQQAEDRLRERATYLAEAEHKLKSPLTVIRGWTELLAEDWPQMTADERSEALRIIQSAGSDAARQVDQLLDEARSEVQSLQLRSAPVEVADLLVEVARQLHGAASDAHRVTSEHVEPAVVLADREALWQVVWHLAENALKYSPAGGRIDLGSRRTESGTVEVTVTDEGLGVPTDVDLFAPFVRGGAEHVGSIPGTGLGLHIVQTLVRGMHGTVAALPRPEGGSVFRITLPVAS